MKQLHKKEAVFLAIWDTLWIIDGRRSSGLSSDFAITSIIAMKYHSIKYVQLGILSINRLILKKGRRRFSSS